MVTIVIVLLVAMISFIGVLSFRKRITKGCCDTGDQTKVKKYRTDQNLRDYPYTAYVHIEGMHCADCVNKVSNAYAEKGCLAEVSLSRKEAVVHMKQKLSDEILTAVPERIGYDASIMHQ